MAKPQRTNLTIHDFRPGSTSGRFVDPRGVLQTSLSSLENDVMRMLAYEAPVVAMESQRLLVPNEEVIEISQSMGIRPPRLGPKQHMSTDILIRIHFGPRDEWVAVNVKSAEKAWVPKEVVKRNIGEEYWRRRGFTHRLVTDERCHMDYRRNLRHADACHSGSRFQQTLSCREDVFTALCDLLDGNLRSPLGLLTDTLDKQCALDVGDAMTLLWGALWRGSLAADLERPLTAFSPAARLRVLPWRSLSRNS